MSLYGGIKFSLADDSASSGIARNGKDDGKDGNASSASSSKTPAQALASAGFSSSLKFAPRLNKSKAAVKPAGTTFNAGVLEKQAEIHRSGAGVSSSGPGSNGHDGAEAQMQAKEQVQLGLDGRPLASAPSMTMAQEKRPKRDREEERLRQKRKKKRKQQQQLVANFNPDEAYDPTRPNDLGEYQQYRKRLRAERRAKYLQEKRRREAGESSGSSYYTDSEDEAPRRDAPKMFAPPQMYSPPKRSAPLPAAPPSPPRQYAPPPPPAQPAPSAAPAVQAATGDDAYARRQALSAAQSGDDAYARRLALSQGVAPAAPPPPPVRAYTPPPPPPAVTSAMPPFPPAPPAVLPPFAPTTAGVMPPFPPGPSLAGHAPPMPPFPPAPGPMALPPFPASSVAPALPPFPPSAPPSMPPYVPSSSSAAGPSSTPMEPAAADPGFDAALEQRKKAAAAIAAKFSNLKPAPPKMEDLTGTFAEKMMKKWGHVEGTGIGARGDGLVHALSAEHVAKPTDPNKILSKRQLAKQRVATANAKKRQWVQAPSARGRIVDANAEARAIEEKAKVGDASRIVCLVGLVESEEDVDEELPEEIGEECSKYGIVERVVLHMVEPPPPEPSECLRVFVVLSGMAGAWRVVKEMDGRFFGGRKIRAAYFPEARFDAGDRDGSLI